MFQSVMVAPRPNTNPKDYHAAGAEIPKGSPEFIMSRSALADFGRNPHKWRVGPKEKASKAMNWGSLMDCLFLTPDLFATMFAVSPETYPCKPTSKDPREEKPWTYKADHCQQWKEEQEAAGLMVCSHADYAAGQVALEILMRDPVIAEVRQCCDVQVEFRVEWHCAHTKLVIPVKVLCDMVARPDSKYGRGVFDFKTTADASVDHWQRHLFDQEHYYQAAFYLDAINAATGLSYDLFGNLVQEGGAPFETARRAMDPDFLELGRKRYQSDFTAYCLSLKNDVWPGYDDRDINNEEHPVIDGFRVMSPAKWMLTKASF